MLPELDATKNVTWNFYVDESQKNSPYDMIIGHDLLLELKLDLCLSYCTIKGNSMKYPSDLRDEAIFRN